MQFTEKKQASKKFKKAFSLTSNKENANRNTKMDSFIYIPYEPVILIIETILKR